jgi:hypothetical protein
MANDQPKCDQKFCTKKTAQHTPLVAKTSAQRPRWFVECDAAKLATCFRHDALGQAQVD